MQDALLGSITSVAAGVELLGPNKQLNALRNLDSMARPNRVLLQASFRS